MPRKQMIALVAALAVIAGAVGVWAGLLRHRPAAAPPPGATVPGLSKAEVTLAPTRADASGVDPASAFTLTAERALDLAQVRQQLTVQPPVTLRIEKADLTGKTFTVQPAQPLDPAQVYRFTMAPAAGVSRPYKWSFQTRAAFRLLGTLPRDQASGVPVNTGIELTFSHEDYTDLDSRLRISPAVPGRFERHGKTAVFVPAEPLKPGTVYTVTLAKGVARQAGGDQLTADVTFRFETAASDGGKSPEYLYVPAEPQDYRTTDAPYLQVFYKREGGAPTVDVQVWRYSDAAAYIAALSKLDAIPAWAQYSRNQAQEDPAGLTAVTNFAAKPQTFPGIPNEYLVFPAPLPPGYYLAELKVAGQRKQVHFQVTDLSSYHAITSTRTLVWVNDLATQAPLAGASVTLAGSSTTVRTDAGGVAVLPTPAAAGDQPRGGYFVIRSGDREAVAGGVQPTYYRGPYSWDASALYWRYLYLDRGLYKPDDTVNFWGVLAPREAGAPAIDAVTVEVIRYDYSGPNGQPIPLASALLPVRDGTFTGSLSLPGLKPGWYSLQVRHGDDFFTSRGFEVQTYTKPAYKLSVTANKRAVFTGEPVDFTVQASFFEGTPVPNLGLVYSLNWGEGSQQTVSTDAAGQAVLHLTPRGDGYSGSMGQGSAWFTLRAASPEAGELSTSTVVQIFSRNVTTEPAVQVKGSQAVLSGVLRKVNLAQLNAGTGWEYAGDPAPGQAVRATLVEHSWVKEDAGEVYDFIDKTVHKAYNYRQESKTVGSFTATTGADGAYSLTLPVAADKSYEVTLEAQDYSGQWLARHLWFSGNEIPVNPYTWQYYSLAPEAAGRYTWGVGEPVSLLLRAGQNTVPDRPQGFLFYTARLGLQAYRVQDTSRFQFSLQAGDPPNSNVRAVYFNGRTYHETQEYTVRFNPDDRKLTVAVTPDKAEYRPGDTVNLAVRVTDAGGRPVQAQVNLNLVDEALYALMDQRVDLLGDLYGDHVPSGILRTHATHAVPEPGSGAEKGGEGGGVRKDFQDAIYFNTVRTDASGQATASFRVPDNLTSWRVTYQAVVPGTMQAGSGTAAIPVKLPFFADLVLGETYLSGDTPVALVRSYGTALSAGQRVEYRMMVRAPDGTASSQSASGDAFATVPLPLPKLQTGHYEVTVEATAPGGLSDALARNVSVVDTYLRQEKVEYYQLSPDLRLKGADKGLTTLTFTDHQRSAYLQLLDRLRWSWGRRFEQQLAGSVAAELLHQYFAEPVTPSPVDTFAHQTPAGGIAILPYADADLELSAFAADLAPGRFDRATLRDYLSKVVADPQASRERAAVALYGLAGLGEPVLTEVQARLQAPDLSREERLFLALAQATLGDLEGARPAYYQLLAGGAEPLGDALRMKVSESPDAILVATARTGLLAAKLGEAQAPLFVRYLLTAGSSEVLVNLEEALLAKAALPELAGQAVGFSYSLNGQTVSKSLQPRDSFTLALTPAELAAIRFAGVQGEVGVTVRYQAPLDPGTVQKDPDYSVTRSIKVDGKPAGATLAPGDLVQVTLSYKLAGSAPDGGFVVVDYLPSGLRLVQRPFQWGNKSETGEWYNWPIEVDGQRLVFWADPKQRPITYYARVASPGQYTAEQPALAHNLSGKIYGLGQREQVSIQ